MKKALENAPVYSCENLSDLITYLEKESKANIWLVDERFQPHVLVERALFLTAGEPLKEVSSFLNHMPQILEMASGLDRNEITVIALGGGSISDFAGFVASVLKRGVKLKHIPSTWLSAIDSAHGGKTALNLKDYKNQIGTFYPAEKIFLVTDLLNKQSDDLQTDAKAELIKMALLKDADLLNKIDSFESAMLTAINYKYEYIKIDPLEKTGLRSELNLGHTLGHLLELHHKISHGKAVGQGLHLAIQFSVKRGYLDMAIAEKIKMILNENAHPYLGLRLSRQDAENILKQDKKMDENAQLRFVFLEKIGKARVEKIAITEILDFLKEEACLT